MSQPEIIHPHTTERDYIIHFVNEALIEMRKAKRNGLLPHDLLHSSKSSSLDLSNLSSTEVYAELKTAIAATLYYLIEDIPSQSSEKIS